MSSSNTTQYPEPPSQEERRTQEQLAIEAPPSAEAATELRVDGDAVKLHKLGPIVINTDGSISRINNWQEMTGPEQQAASKLVARRNEIRRKALLEREKEQDKEVES